MRRSEEQAQGEVREKSRPVAPLERGRTSSERWGLLFRLLYPASCSCSDSSPESNAPVSLESASGSTVVSLGAVEETFKRLAFLFLSRFLWILLLALRAAGGVLSNQRVRMPRKVEANWKTDPVTHSKPFGNMPILEVSDKEKKAQAGLRVAIIGFSGVDFCGC